MRFLLADLFHAISTAHVATLLDALLQGQCPNFNEAGVCPLYASLLLMCPPASSQAGQIVDVLCQAMADVDCRLDFSGRPMHLACRQGLHEAAASLLKATADVNAHDNEHDTPLHVAAVAGDLACVRLLIENSADVGATNLLAETALAAAVDTRPSCHFLDRRSACNIVALLMDAKWPQDCGSIMFMNMSVLAPSLGLSRFKLFSAASAFSKQKEFYPDLQVSGGSCSSSFWRALQCS